MSFLFLPDVLSLSFRAEFCFPMTYMLGGFFTLTGILFWENSHVYQHLCRKTA